MQSFDQRFELLSSNILDCFTELATTMSARMSNPLFSAESVVPVRKPVHGQDPSLSPPVSIGGCHCQFQWEGEDPVPRRSGYAQPSTFGKFLDRDVNVGPGLHSLKLHRLVVLGLCILSYYRVGHGFTLRPPLAFSS